MIINFMQNDDWVYYRIVANFLRGDFSLDPITAPTFYTQGLLGMLFAKMFGIANLPILTLIISVLSYLLLSHILSRFYKVSVSSSLILSAFMLFNPWFVYSSVGFMTENYFMFFILLCLYFFHLFEETHKNKHLVGLFISILLAFLLRQVSMVFPIAMSVYYLLKKDIKHSLLSMSFFIFLYSFYTYIFPKTAEMYEKPLQFQHLINLDYSFALIYGSLLVFVALFIPLIISFIKSNFKKVTILKLVLFTGLSIVLYIILNNHFKPSVISWGEFPYFENIWERFGLYPRGVRGTKYQFRWNYDLYLYWDLTAKVLLSSFISYIVVFFEKRKLQDFNLLFCGLYLGLMLLTETFYDRYLLILIPFVLLFLVKNIDFSMFNKLIIVGFIVFLGFYSYQFGMDFVISNNYIWNKSVQLVETENIEPKMIHGTNAWKLNYLNVERNYEYVFSYDSSAVNDSYSRAYTLVETKDINYPLNIFINPKIYLYKKIIF